MKSAARTFDADDARLSAYVLGELEGGERAAVEALLAESEEARAYVDELRRVADELAEELGREAAPGLTVAQRRRIEERIAAPAGPRPLGRRRWRRRLVALAASTAVAFVGGWLVLQRVQRRESGAPFTYTIFGGGAVGSAPAAERGSGGRFGGRFGGRRATGTTVAARVESLRSLGYEGAIEDEAGVRHDTEAYDHVAPNPFRRTADEALSTFSIDVDTASYANARRFLLREGRLPPASSVRVEEFVNYFRYADPAPTSDEPFAVRTEVASCPWAPSHRLVRVGLRARDIPAAERPASNLVFLIDVSGSMSSADKLPLLKRAMKLLVEQLDARDRVAIVVYAGSSGLALPSTACSDAWAVMDALDRLQAGGSTNGGEGIRLAYRIARENLVEGGLNRVILCTDGDFNVGVSDDGSLVRLIEEERKSGVFLSVLGFGTGNLKDSKMEKLADKGNGNYAYIDGLDEARKVLVAQMGGTLLPVAKDVKIQVELNPAEVQAWRLIGYENRLLAHTDFNDDTKDAGEIGAGLSVTALYEIVPHGVALPAGLEQASVDPLRYQTGTRPSPAAFGGELMLLRLRYKPVDGDASSLIEAPVRDPGGTWYEASDDFKRAAGVAAFAMRLRGDPELADTPFELIVNLLRESMGDDPHGYRAEALRLVERAADLTAASREGQRPRELGY